MDDQILKECSKCGFPKPLNEFGARKTSADGKQGRCLICANAYHRSYFDRNLSKHRPTGDRPAYMKRLHVAHKEFLAEFKAKPCLDCAGSFPACCMEFDHVRGQKRHNIAEMASWARETVLAEVAKCELICSNCHRIRTESRRAARKLNRHLAKFRAFVAELKKAPCVDCKNCFAPTAMDFDHVRGTKVASISNMWMFSREEILAEIAKCDLVCANCHRLRTASRPAQKAA